MGNQHLKFLIYERFILRDLLEFILFFISFGNRDYTLTKRSFLTRVNHNKYTTRKSKCYQVVLFLNEVIGPYVLTILCVDMSNIFV